MILPDKIPPNSVSFKRLNSVANKLIDFVASLRPQSSPSAHPKWISSGVSWEVPMDTPASGSDVRRLSIKTVAANYIICNPSNPEAAADTIDTTTEYVVAKDATFRGNDPRTIVGPSGVLILQDLEPHYSIGQVIYAIFGIDGGTGVKDANDDYIENLEISPSRQWVDPWVKVCASIDGVQHQIAVRGSGIIPGT